jgi:hypothetical protein
MVAGREPPTVADLGDGILRGASQEGDAAADFEENFSALISRRNDASVADLRSALGCRSLACGKAEIPDGVYGDGTVAVSGRFATTVADLRLRVESLSTGKNDVAATIH